MCTQRHTSIFLITDLLMAGCAGIRNIRLQKMRLKSGSGFKSRTSIRSFISNSCEARTNGQFKPLHLFGIVITAFLLASTPHQSQAATAQSKHKAVQNEEKERLVLMPLRVPNEEKELAGAMETALVQSLQQKYAVFSGEQVSQKAHQIFMKESRNAAHFECDETRCMQNIAEAFQAELIATANVTKQEGSYFLALSIRNIFDNKVVDSKSEICENCKATQVIAMLKVLSGNQEITEAEKLEIATEGNSLPDAAMQDSNQLLESQTPAEPKRKNNASRSKSHEVETANASPLGFVLGVATYTQVKQQAGSNTSLSDGGTNPYSGGKVLEGRGGEFGVEGLSNITFIFDPSEKLVAVYMTLPKDNLKDTLKALSAKYKLIAKDVPFVGDASAELQQGNSVIEISAPHLSFAMNVYYMTKAFNKTYTQQSSQEEAAREKLQAARF